MLYSLQSLGKENNPTKPTSLHQSEMFRISPHHACRPDYPLLQLVKQIPRNGSVSSIVQRMFFPVFRVEWWSVWCCCIAQWSPYGVIWHPTRHWWRWRLPAGGGPRGQGSGAVEECVFAILEAAEWSGWNLSMVRCARCSTATVTSWCRHVRISYKQS